MKRCFKTAWLICLFVSLVASAADERYTEFGIDSQQGRQLWIANCEGCHGYGIAGAPIPMRTKDWSERIGKPRLELYEHAIEGFFGPGDTYMPARGGNTDLTDDEVKMAVDYMVALAIHYLNLQMEAEK